MIAAGLACSGGAGGACAPGGGGVGGGASSRPLPEILSVARRPLAAGAYHTCAIVAGGAVRGWGDNENGQLGRAAGDGGARAAAGPAVDLGSGRTAKAIFAGTYDTCAILDDDQVKCWGLNGAGQLGLEDMTNRGDGASAMGDGLPVVRLGQGQRAVALATGDTATCALLATGRIKCWGDTYRGALGYGDNESRGGSAGTMGDALPLVDLGSHDGAPLLATAIGAVDYHSFCAILKDSGPGNSALKCWGSNDYCELGLGTRDGGRGDGPGMMGNALPWVDIGTTAAGARRKAVALAAGYQFMCVLGDDGAVKCWGDNHAGQLGLGAAGPPRSCERAEMGNAGLVALPAPAAAIAARGASDGGGAHVCALLKTGDVRCWGENASGQLGTAGRTPVTVPSPPLAFGDGFVPAGLVLGGHHSCAVAADDRIKCWGGNQKGQLGPSVTGDLQAPGPYTTF